LKHEGTGVQGRQALGSPRVSSLQDPAPSLFEPSHTYDPLPEGSSQQPKQSQPLGTYGRQVSRQVSLCAEFNSSQDESSES
jgi:hypothetical protein